MAEAAPSPAAPFREGHIEVDAWRIRYMEAGQGSPVVMLDAITWGLWQLHDALAQKHRVVAFELPGSGHSPANAGSRSVKDLAGTMAQAAAKVVPEKYTLVGTSSGANVALWQTLQAPDQVEALILISPTAIRPTGGATHDAEAESRLSEIQCPTLVVFGLADRMVAPEAASIYRERIPNSNLSIVYDAGHLIVVDRPEALINAVSDYVERRETFIVSRQTSIINP